MPEPQDVKDIEFLGLGDPAPNPQPNPNDGEGGNDNDTVDDTTVDDTDDNKTDNQVTDNDTVEDDSPDGGEGAQPEDNTDDTDDSPDTNASDGDDTDEGDQPSIFESMVERAGIELDDETKQLISEAEMTDEGVANVANIIAERKAQQQFNSLIEQHPEAAQLINYKVNGGDPQEFFDTYYPETDYSEVEITEDNIDVQKQVVANALELQGLDKEDINEQIEDLETAGVLEKTAQRSLKSLRKHQQKRQEDFEAKQEKLQENRRKQAQQQYNDTVELIEQGEINGIKIPDKQKDQFISYLFEPVNEQGATQAQLDGQELGLEQRLLMAYLTYSDYNLDDFINKQASSKKARSIKDALDKSNNKENLKGKGNTPKEKPGKPEDIVSPFDIN